MRRFVLGSILILPLTAQISVLTFQYDNTRAGVNRRETVLTPVNVNSTSFGRLFSNAVDGYIYGQPLYLANVEIPGKGTRNVVYVATQRDSVYAFDADTQGAPLWQVNFLGAGVTSVPNADVGCSQIVPEIGITSTPVIDADAGTIFVVAMTKESGNYVHRLHSLDVTTGAEKAGSPVVIEAAYPGTADGGNTVVFQPRNYKQRPGLLLLNGIVYLAWSSHCDIGRYHGWLMAYDAQTLRRWLFTTTPQTATRAHSGTAAPPPLWTRMETSTSSAAMAASTIRPADATWARATSSCQAVASQSRITSRRSISLPSTSATSTWVRREWHCSAMKPARRRIRT